MEQAAATRITPEAHPPRRAHSELVYGIDDVPPLPQALFAALEMAVFEEEDALDRFEAFASLNGPAFYGLPVNQETVTLRREPHIVPEKLEAAGAPIIPFHAGEQLNWRMV